MTAISSFFMDEIIIKDINGRLSKVPNLSPYLTPEEIALFLERVKGFGYIIQENAKLPYMNCSISITRTRSVDIGRDGNVVIYSKD